MASKGKIKGSNYELQIAKFFKELGYANCRTSRLESKFKDDQGIDLCNTGNWQIQCKAVERLEPYHNILARMPDGDNLVFHKRNRAGTVVAMTEDTFKKILLLLIDSGSIKPQ